MTCIRGRQRLLCVLYRSAMILYTSFDMICFYVVFFFLYIPYVLWEINKLWTFDQTKGSVRTIHGRQKLAKHFMTWIILRDN